MSMEGATLNLFSHTRETKKKKKKTPKEKMLSYFLFKETLTGLGV